MSSVSVSALTGSAGVELLETERLVDFFRVLSSNSLVNPASERGRIDLLPLLGPLEVPLALPPPKGLTGPSTGASIISSSSSDSFADMEAFTTPWLDAPERGRRPFPVTVAVEEEGATFSATAAPVPSARLLPHVLGVFDRWRVERVGEDCSGADGSREELLEWKDAVDLAESWVGTMARGSGESAPAS